MSVTVAFDMFHKSKPDFLHFYVNRKQSVPLLFAIYLIHYGGISAGHQSSMTPSVRALATPTVVSFNDKTKIRTFMSCLPIHPARLAVRSLHFEINNSIQPMDDSQHSGCNDK